MDEGHPRRWLILAVMCLSLVLIVAAVSSLNLAIPTIRGALNASGTQLLWIVDSYGLVFAGFLLPAGALGDRFGRREALIVGLLIVLVTSVGASYAGSPAALIAWRSAMGLGAALMMPATLSIVTVVFPKRERSRAIAIWVGFAGAGGALGLLGGGILLEAFWWGSVFFVNVPIAAAALIATVAIVPTSRDSEKRPLDCVGAVVSIVGLAALLYAIIEGPARGWGEPLTIAGFVAAAVLLTSFVLWELRTNWPMLDPRFFKNRRFSIGSISITMVFLTMFGFFFVITQYFQFVQGLSPLNAAVRTLPLTGIFILISPLSVTLKRRFGGRATVTFGLLVGALGFGMFGLLTPDSPYWFIVIPMMIMSGGMAMMMAQSSEAIVTSLPQDKAGVGSAVNDTTREVGGAIGIAVMGSILAVGYRSGLGDVVDTLTPESAERVRDSIGQALAVAADAPAEQARLITDAAANAYTDGLALAFFVSAGLMVATAIVVAVFHAGDGPEVQAPEVQAQETQTQQDSGASPI